VVLGALHTGLRRGNLLGLRWSQVDLGGRRITIPAEETKANAELAIPIHPELAEVLRGLLRGRDRVEPHAPVIGIEVKELKASFLSAARRAGLGHLRFHDLRHTAATWWGERCTHAVLQQLLGHAPGSMSLKYVHVPFAKLRQVVDRMPRLLAAPAPAVAAAP
jgi:integrase